MKGREVSFVIFSLCINSSFAATLTQPLVIRATADSSRSIAVSWNATMSVEASFIDNGDIAFWTRSYCYEGTCSYPGPTLELLPGDNFTLTLENKLGPNPEGEDTTMNSMHSPNSTNLHTHGMHIDPEVDTVFVHAAPGETLVYNYEIPNDHAPGLYWHHDHVHGGSALRVMGGLVGAIVVKPTGNEGLPTSITNANEHILVLTPMHVDQEKDNNGYVSQACSNSATCDPETQPPDCTEANKASSTTFSPFRQYSFRELSAATNSSMNASVILANKGSEVTDRDWTYYENEICTTFTNGQFEPTLTVDSGEVVTLRIVHAGGGEELKMKYIGTCTVKVIALDGVYLEDVRSIASSDTIYVMAGSRVDIQMSCTGAGGGLEAASPYSKQTVITLDISGSTQTHDFTTTAELAAITRPHYLTDLTGETVDVYYSNHVSQGSRPTSECGGSDLFWWGAGSDCSAVAPWGSEQPSSTSADCPFGFFVGPRGNNATAYEKANKLVTYTGDGSTDGEVNEWSLYGLGASKHPVHLHVFHMQIISFECVDGSADCTTSDMEDWMTVGDWRDVFPTFAGVLKVRFRASDFPGETVLHCHFLRHEDLGMMDTVLVVDGYRPGYEPTAEPTQQPLPSPTSSPIPAPIISPTQVPISLPTSAPIPAPIISPTQVPISLPTSLPVLSPSQLPTSVPISTPTSVPNPSPTKVPYPAPTSVPLPDPTLVPSIIPTWSPIPAPSKMPTELPVPNPTTQPTPTPTHGPTFSFAPTTGTASPSSVPFPSPTLKPSPTPSYAPSTQDTVKLSVSLSMSATAAPTEVEEATLLSQIANQTDVDTSDINNFDVEYTARRRQLLSGTWAVTFDIVISLASTSTSTASAFETSIVSALNDNSFQSRVESAISSITSFDSVNTVIATKNPSSAPTQAPVVAPTTSIGGGGSSNPSNAALPFIIIAVVVTVLFGIGVMCYFLKSHSSEFEETEETVKHPQSSVRPENLNQTLIQKRKQEKIRRKSSSKSMNSGTGRPSNTPKQMNSKPMGTRIEMM